MHIIITIHSFYMYYLITCISCLRTIVAGSLQDGFQVRLFEFANFERKFEVSEKIHLAPVS